MQSPEAACAAYAGNGKDGMFSLNIRLTAHYRTVAAAAGSREVIDSEAHLPPFLAQTRSGSEVVNANSGLR